MIVNEISLVIKNIRVLMSYFPEEDFTVINLVIAHAQSFHSILYPPHPSRSNIKSYNILQL